MKSLRYSLVLVLVAVLALPVAVTQGQGTIELQLTWWGSQTRHDKTIEVIELFEAEHPDIDIIYEFSNFTDYWTLLSTKAASDSLPDVMQHDYAYLAEWALRGQLMPLDDFIADGTIDVSNIAQSIIDSGKIDGQTYALIRQAGETGHLYGSVAARDVAETIQAEGGKIERSQVVLNTAIKNLGVHEVLVRLHPEVRATVKINVARSAEEAERQAKGEDVIASRFDDERHAAEEQAKDLLEGGAGQQEMAYVEEV